MPPVLTIAAFTVREAQRNRMAWLLGIVVVSSFGLSELVAEVAITEASETKSALLAGFLRLFSVFLVALFVTTSVVRDFNDKVLESILSLPFPRSAYYFGRLIGSLALAILVALTIAAGLLLYATPFQVAIWAASLLCELIIVSTMGLVCIFSFHHLTTALSAVLGFYLLARMIGAIELMGTSPLVPAGKPLQEIVNVVVSGIAFVLPDLYRFTQSRWLMYEGVVWADLVPIAGQTAVYLCLLIGVGLFDLYRKDL
jgi:ABC-type transport system involved in multi-copper enzyme maturation permease subunit